LAKKFSLHQSRHSAATDQTLSRIHAQWPLILRQTFSVVGCHILKRHNVGFICRTDAPQ